MVRFIFTLRQIPCKWAALLPTTCAVLFIFVVALTVHAGEPPLVVHEWGTFTSFSGSDGIRLEYRPLATSDLPAFVREAYGTAFSKRTLMAIQRLETPVTYFYTPVERDVSVSVEFPQGLLTEIYPPAREIAPALTRSRDIAMAETQGGDGSSRSPTLRGGRIDWGRVHLIPADKLVTQVDDIQLARRMGAFLEQTMLPDANGKPYAHARQTDAAIVQVRHAEQRSFASPQSESSGGQPAETFASFLAPTVLAGDYFEKFLFYRGVGQFDLPVRMTSDDGETMQIQNEGSFPLTGVFLIKSDARQLWMRHQARLEAGSSVSLEFGEAETSHSQLTEHMIAALVQEGLYVDEARAMVETWRDSWFFEPGTRLFYILPQQQTQELLPLHVTPEPDETVRVMVGRLEFLPPRTEQRILKLVERSADDADQSGTTPEASAESAPAVLSELKAFGRFADPALVRAAQIAPTPELRARAEELRNMLRPQQ